MASLREIKDHIASVRSTLKITSAMKLVASAKLRKAQQAAEGIRPYTAALSQMLAAVLADGQGSPSVSKPSATGKGPGRVPQGEPGPGIARPMADAPVIPDGRAQNGAVYAREADFGGPRAQNQAFYARETSGADVAGAGRVAIVAVASNSSLCGAFNINVVHRVQELVAECKAAGAGVEVISVGRKMAEAMRKMGFAPEDHADLVGRNSFEKSSAFAQELIDAFNSGRYTRILLVYNHFVSTASQKVQVETYMPFGGGQRMGYTLRTPYPPTDEVGGAQLCWEGPSGRLEEGIAHPSAPDSEYILEPSREEILATLLPQVMRLRIHTVLLDSIASEHAARMLAMQAASDNAEDLLSELTLEYNKGRQQKITSEILDLVGGAQQ